MITHSIVKEIEHKYCTPGHSSIQEVDNIHSQTESAWGPAEIYSLISLMRILKTCNKLKVIQMKPDDFKSYQEISVKCRKYSDVPYSKVKSLLYTRDEPKDIRYKTSFVQDQDFKAVTVISRVETRNAATAPTSSTDIVADLLQGTTHPRTFRWPKHTNTKTDKAYMSLLAEIDQTHNTLVFVSGEVQFTFLPSDIIWNWHNLSFFARHWRHSLGLAMQHWKFVSVSLASMLGLQLMWFFEIFPTSLEDIFTGIKLINRKCLGYMALDKRRFSFHWA